MNVLISIINNNETLSMEMVFNFRIIIMIFYTTFHRLHTFPALPIALTFRIARTFKFDVMVICNCPKVLAFGLTHLATKYYIWWVRQCLGVELSKQWLKCVTATQHFAYTQARNDVVDDDNDGGGGIFSCRVFISFTALSFNSILSHTKDIHKSQWKGEKLTDTLGQQDIMSFVQVFGLLRVTFCVVLAISLLSTFLDLSSHGSFPTNTAWKMSHIAISILRLALYLISFRCKNAFSLLS